MFWPHGKPGKYCLVSRSCHVSSKASEIPSMLYPFPEVEAHFPDDDAGPRNHQEQQAMVGGSSLSLWWSSWYWEHFSCVAEERSDRKKVCNCSLINSNECWPVSIETALDGKWQICVEVALTAELLHNFSEKLPCPKWYWYFLWLKADWSKCQGKSPYLSKWGHNYIQYAKIHNLISKKLKQSIIYKKINDIFYIWFLDIKSEKNIICSHIHVARYVMYHW